MTTFDNTLYADGALIVGAGLAGLFTALKLAPRPVTVLSPKPLGTGASSAWAQGGVAAAMGEGDSPHAHAQDTEMAGAGIVDHGTAEGVTAEAVARIEDLARWGTPFDRDDFGNFELGREAAHSANRIVKVEGDRAGWAIMQAIIAQVRRTPSIRVVEGITALSLARENGRVVGVYCRKLGDRYSEPIFVRARATVLAAGG
ncbi:FAD-binding protein, partial [Devosia equisanguinis]